MAQTQSQVDRLLVFHAKARCIPLIAVLALWIIGSVVIGGQSHVPGWIMLLLTTMVALVSLFAITTTRRRFVIGIVLLLVSEMDTWVPGLEGLWRSSLFGVGQLFYWYVVVLIFGYVYRGSEMTPNRIYAAICVYQILVLIFASLYKGMIAWQGAKAFTGIASVAGLSPDDLELLTNAELAQRLSGELVYFSAVTQTTLGYGEISPGTPAARGLVVLQAMLGVLFIAVTIARLVGGRKND